MRVEKVDLILTADDIFYGVLPTGIGDLEKLIIDQPLTGPIPPSLGHWSIPTLGNALSGEIPPELGNMTNLNPGVLWRLHRDEELGNLAIEVSCYRLEPHRVHTLCFQTRPNIQIKGLPPC